MARAPQETIIKKRDGRALDAQEIRDAVRGATSGSWADYQVSAFLMAIFMRGMNADETAALTESMMRSGDVLDLSSIDGVKTDKHSTGGVGDKVSIPLAPLVASCGVPVPMISGRGLGHTGGTLDKLESIPGLRTNLEVGEFMQCVRDHGLCLIGQTDRLAPADRKLYALRDVTGTVESIPLIVSSILSKKLAEGLDALVLDVKVGSGAFMQREEDANELAQALVAVTHAMGKMVTAFLTSMDQPLGMAIGNACEVRESIALLQGSGPEDLIQLVKRLGGEMLRLAGAVDSVEAGEHAIQDAIDSGRGLETFERMVEAQGGDPCVIDDDRILPRAPEVKTIQAERSGWLAIRDVRAFGLAALDLGAGRTRAGMPIDPRVGIVLGKKHGEPVSAGEVLLTLEHASHGVDAASERLATAFEVVDSEVPAAPLLRKVIRPGAKGLVECMTDADGQLPTEGGL